MKRLVLITILCALSPLAALSQTQTSAQPKINKKNLVIEEWNQGPKGTSEMLDHKTTFNADGKKLEEIEYDGDGKKKWTKRYEYDASGKVSRELVYDNYNRLQTYKKFEYNEFGRKKMQYTYNAKDKLIGIKKYKYIAQEVD